MKPEAIAAMMEVFPDAMIVATGQGKVVHWSDGARQMFGYSAAEAADCSLIDMIIPHGRLDLHERMLAETIANGSAIYETVRRRKDGSLLYVDVSTKKLLGIDTAAALLLSVEKDVTDIKVRRDAKLMEARFRELLESTPDGIVMADQTGHIVLVNSQLEKLFGYQPGELRGKPVEMLLPAQFRQNHVGHRSHYFTAPRQRVMNADLDLTGLRKDGSEFPLEISLSPLRTDDGDFVLSAIRDISERRQFQRQLQEKNAELARLNEAKDHFLANMSHELRTPLNAILGFTGTLLMKLPGPLTADQEKQLKTVRTSARHLLALINDLLDIAKIESGKVDLAFEDVDCNALLEEVAFALRPDAESKGLQLRLEMPQQPLVVSTDRRSLSQIVLNLTSNAIKFTDEGHVLLTLTEIPETERGSVRIAVEDTGVGISEADQGKLFGAFSRVNSARLKAPEGTGLGLHLSRKLAHALGGEITCRSEAGKGSVFSMILPEK
jgi:PAS domain S-box-containing protein